MNVKCLFVIASLFVSVTTYAAYQYNTKGRQGWLTFDSTTTVAFDLSRSGKDAGKEQENFIDRGDGIADYGWYNLDTGATGSFNNGLSATFTESDRIGLYVKDNTGTVYTSTKPNGKDDHILWGKSRIIDDALSIAGGNMGSNGTHEYYIFKVNTANANGGKAPSGQPLPGILAVLAVGGVALGAGQMYRRKKGKAAK